MKFIMVKYYQSYARRVTVMKMTMNWLINLMIYPFYIYIFFAAEYELRCMRNALDMGDNEEIIDIAKRFYRVCVLLLQLSFIMVSYTELVNCSLSESALLL